MIIKRIVVFVNLFLSPETEKQALKALIKIRNKSIHNRYVFDLESLASERILKAIKGKAGDEFADLKNQPLKGHLNLTSYLKDKGFVKRTISKNKYQITSSGLDKIAQLENINLTLFRIISFFGSIGGLTYLLDLLKRYFIK